MLKLEDIDTTKLVLLYSYRYNMDLYLVYIKYDKIILVIGVTKTNRIVYSVDIIIYLKNKFSYQQQLYHVNNNITPNIYPEIIPVAAKFSFDFIKMFSRKKIENVLLNIKEEDIKLKSYEKYLSLVRKEKIEKLLK